MLVPDLNLALIWVIGILKWEESASPISIELVFVNGVGYDIDSSLIVLLEHVWTIETEIEQRPELDILNQLKEPALNSSLI